MVGWLCRVWSVLAFRWEMFLLEHCTEWEKVGDLPVGGTLTIGVKFGEEKE